MGAFAEINLPLQPHPAPRTGVRCGWSRRLIYPVGGFWTGAGMATVTTWVVFIGLAVGGILFLHHYGIEIPQILGHGLRSVEASLDQPLF